MTSIHSCQSPLTTGMHCLSSSTSNTTDQGLNPTDLCRSNEAFLTPFNYGLSSTIQSAFRNRPNQYFFPTSPAAVEQNDFKINNVDNWCNSLNTHEQYVPDILKLRGAEYDQSNKGPHDSSNLFGPTTRVMAENGLQMLPVHGTSFISSESRLTDGTQTNFKTAQDTNAPEVPSDFSLQNKSGPVLFDINPALMADLRKKSLDGDDGSSYSDQIFNPTGLPTNRSGLVSAGKLSEYSHSSKTQWNSTACNNNNRSSPQTELQDLADLHANNVTATRHTCIQQYAEEISSPGSSSSEAHRAPHIAAAAACVAAAAAAVVAASAAPGAAFPPRPPTDYPSLMSTQLEHYKPYEPRPHIAAPYPFVPQSTIRAPYDTLRHFTSSNFHRHSPNCFSYTMDGARRKNATRESTTTLKVWLQEHIKNPYPTKGEKIMLAIITKMTLTQVSTWFANARRRLKKENKMSWPPKTNVSGSRPSSDRPHSNSPCNLHGKLQHVEPNRQRTSEKNLNTKGEKTTDITTNNSEDNVENADVIDEDDEEESNSAEFEVNGHYARTHSRSVSPKKTDFEYLEVMHPGYNHFHVDENCPHPSMTTVLSQMTKLPEPPVRFQQNVTDLSNTVITPYPDVNSNQAQMVHTCYQRSLAHFPLPFPSKSPKETQIPMHPSSPPPALQNSHINEAVGFGSSLLSIPDLGGLRTGSIPFTKIPNLDAAGSQFLSRHFLPYCASAERTDSEYIDTIIHPKQLHEHPYMAGFQMNNAAQIDSHFQSNSGALHPNFYGSSEYSMESKDN